MRVILAALTKIYLGVGGVKVLTERSTFPSTQFIPEFKSLLPALF
jgi:hypothetical protein